MSQLTKFRPKSLLQQFLHCKHLSTVTTLSPSTILTGDPKQVLTSHAKTRAALSLIKTESNPEKILDICRAAALTPESHMDRVAFSVAISKLVKHNYYEGIRGFLEELKDRPDLKNERFFNHSILLYGQAGMPNNAIATFEQMEQLGVRRTVKSFNTLLLSCIFAKKYDEVKRIFTDFPKTYNLEPDIDTYNTVIKSFSEAGESNSTYSILAEMDRKGCKPNRTTFSNMLAGFYKEEKFEDVEKVLKLMKEHGLKLGLSTFNVRIKSLCQMGRSAEAKALLDGMLEKGKKPNAHTYSNLIHGFCSEGKLADAKKLFKSMVNHGCKPDSACYFTIIYYLCKGGDYETAFQISKESIARTWFPYSATMKSLVEGLISISKIEEAKELITLIKEKFPNNSHLWKETEEKLSL